MSNVSKHYVDSACDHVADALRYAMNGLSQGLHYEGVTSDVSGMSSIDDSDQYIDSSGGLWRYDPSATSTLTLSDGSSVVKTGGMVFRDGLLQSPGTDYTTDSAGNLVFPNGATVLPNAGTTFTGIGQQISGSSFVLPGPLTAEEQAELQSLAEEHKRECKAKISDGFKLLPQQVKDSVYDELLQGQLADDLAKCTNVEKSNRLRDLELRSNGYLGGMSHTRVQGYPWGLTSNGTSAIPTKITSEHIESQVLHELRKWLTDEEIIDLYSNDCLEKELE